MTLQPSVRLHAFLPYSRANGPGWRAVLWTQGCSLGCPGCCNPGTHPADEGECASVDSLAARIEAIASGIEGITLSGGEPLEQAGPIASLLDRVRSRTSLSVILFTGFEWAELEALDAARAVLAHVDVVFAGRYRPGNPSTAYWAGPWKTRHLITCRYSAAELDAVAEAEVVLLDDASCVVTGVRPPNDRSPAREDV